MRFSLLSLLLFVFPTVSFCRPPYPVDLSETGRSLEKAPTPTVNVTSQQPRQVTTVLILAALAFSMGGSIFDKIDEDKEDRSEFTQQLLEKLAERDPYKNYVIVHTKHTAKWNGDENKDWAHKHIEFDVKIGGTIGYEVYISEKAGEFKLQGDGGYLNWAYNGYVNKKKTSSTKKHYFFDDAPAAPADQTIDASDAAIPSETGEGFTFSDAMDLSPI